MMYSGFVVPLFMKDFESQYHTRRFEVGLIRSLHSHTNRLVEDRLDALIAQRRALDVLDCADILLPLAALMRIPRHTHAAADSSLSRPAQHTSAACWHSMLAQARR